MRILSLGLLALSAAAVVGCSRPPSTRATALSDSAPRTQAAGATPGAKDASPVPLGPTLPQLAYSYQAQVQASADAIPGLLARQEAACQRVGAAVCQVIGAERATEQDDAHAELKLRAQPAWLRTFRDGLAADVRPFGGKVTSTSTTSEDLTRDIVDTDAALRAKSVLAERLQQLLATHQGKLSDLLDVEKALAQTQGEIDAARSELAVMHARVDTSDLTLTYTSRLAFTGAWRPVGEAARGAVAVFAQAVAAMIVLIAALAPFAILGAAGVVLWRWLRRHGRRAAPSPAD